MPNSEKMTTLLKSAFLALSLGPALGGYFIGKSIERMKANERKVVVKGIAEREVQADRVVWELQITNVGTGDIKALLEKTRLDQRAVITFLKEKGFDESAITVRSPVVDTRFSEQLKEKSHDIRLPIQIRTTEVQKVFKATREIVDLISSGITISGDPQYYYTKFQEIRPVMIAEATKSARLAANQFAQDSGAQVGYILNAQQGIFSITGVDNSGTDYDYNELKSYRKKVRVVSTVTFALN